MTITSLTSTKPWPTGKVQAVERPASTVAPHRLTALKQAFAAYAKSNKAYREKVKFPDFEADHIATAESVANLGRVLIHFVQMPVATQLELLPLSDADRVEQLIKVMEESTSGGTHPVTGEQEGGKRGILALLKSTFRKWFR